MDRNDPTPSGLVAVKVIGHNGKEHVDEHPMSGFEQSEQGVQLGRRTIPWARVRRATWFLPPKEATVDEPMGMVRVVLDDGTPEGEEEILASERFETSPWAINLLLEDRVDLDAGTVVYRRVVVPWHAVVEYERMATDSTRAGARGSGEQRPDKMPIRPDVSS
jgi:hypothetical protein